MSLEETGRRVAPATTTSLPHISLRPLVPGKPKPAPITSLA